MKVEVNTFSLNNSSATILLEDDTINIKGIYFQVAPTSSTGESSTGFTDGTRNRAKSLLVTSTQRKSYRSNNYCITHYKEVGGVPTCKVAAKIATGGLSTPGEFELTVDYFDATINIDYMVIGD